MVNAQMSSTDVSTSPFRTRINLERLSEQLRSGTFYIDPFPTSSHDKPLTVRPDGPIIHHVGDPDPDYDHVPDPVKPIGPVDPINPDRIDPNDYDNPLITGPGHPDYDPFRDPLIHSRPNYDIDQYRDDINDIDPLSCTSINLTKNLRIVGSGISGETCMDRIPVVVDDRDNVIIHVQHHCVDRSCPVCVDRGFVKTTAQRETDDLVRWMISRLRIGEHYDIVPDTGRPYQRDKVYHVIVSMGPDVDYSVDPGDVERDRRFIIKVLKRLGMERGNIICHPYRGPSMPDGPLRRASLRTDKPSGHWHIVGISKYLRSLSSLINDIQRVIDRMVERSGRGRHKLGPGYHKRVRELEILKGMIVKIPDRNDPDNGMGISGILGSINVSRGYRPDKTYPDDVPGPTDELRGRINKVLSYELDHAGYWDGCQTSVRFGERVDHDPDDDRPDPRKTWLLKDLDRGIINEYPDHVYRDPDGNDHDIGDMPVTVRERIDRELRTDDPFGNMNVVPMNGNMLKTGYHAYRDIDQTVEKLLYDNGGREWDHRICRMVIRSRERIKRLIRGDA